MTVRRNNGRNVLATGEVVVGVDIGGTNTTVGLVDETGSVVLQSTFLTRPHESAVEFVSRLARVIHEMMKGLPPPNLLRGVGIASPAANSKNGTIENPANLSWGSVNIIELVKRHFNLPVAITRDANAALLGERLYGAAQGFENVIMITLGTGLGAGVAVGGKLVEGENGAAGEFGHITLDPRGRFCGCGRRGCVETYVSASGLRRTVFELLADRIEESKLRSVSFESLTAEMVSALAREGDAVALAALTITGQCLGRLIANLAAAFDPHAVVLFGGLVNAGDLLIGPARQSFEEHALKIYRGRVRILVSSLNNGQAAVLGASCLVQDRLLASGVI